MRARPHLRELIDHSLHEVTVRGEIDDVPFKGRIDILASKDGLEVSDIKTTDNIDMNAFGKVFYRFRYAEKLAIYRHLVEQHFKATPEVSVIAQETKDDFDNAYIPVRDAYLAPAFKRVRRIVERFKQAKKTGVWPGVDEGQDCYELLLPNFAFEDEDLDWSELPQASDEPVEIYF